MRAATFLIGLLVVMEVLIAVWIIDLGLTWLMVALLVVTPLMAVYLAYLIWRVSKAS